MRAALLGLVALGACAQTPEPAPAGKPEVTLTPGLPASPQARLYGDCIAQATAAGAFNRERDGGTLRFTCTGDVAKRFYDGLAAWSAKAGSEYVDGALTWRFSKKLIKDSYGVDGCSFDGQGIHRCVVILNVGEFIEQMDYSVPERG